MKKLSTNWIVAIAWILIISFIVGYATLNYREPLGGIDSMLESVKDKIEYSVLTDRETCVKWSKIGSSTCEQYDKIVEYKYISDEEVQDEMLGELEEDVSKRTEHSRAWNVREGVTGAAIYSQRQHIKVDKVWRKVKLEQTTQAQFLAQTVSWYQKLLIKVALAADTSPFSGVGDGYVENSNSPAETWSDTRDAADGTTAYPTLSTDAAANDGAYETATRLGVLRSFFPFATGAVIAADQEILTATVNVYISYEGVTSKSHAAIESSQADETTLGTGDYDTCGSLDSPTELVDSRVTASAGSYNEYALNDMTVVKKLGEASNCGTNTGWTCICLREAQDIDDVGAPGSNQHTMQYAHTVEFTGTNRDPYIFVEYQAAAVAGAIDSTIIINWEE